MFITSDHIFAAFCATVVVASMGFLMGYLGGRSQ